MATNPYTASRAGENISNVPDYGYQDPAYTAPDELGPYDPPGDPYAARLTGRIGGTPDPQREQNAPIRSYRVNPQAPNAIWDGLDQDKRVRESVTDTREQMREQIDPRAQLGANRWAPNPRSTPPVPTRATSDLSPSTYRFLRSDPQNGGTPRRFNGNHFSLADHRRMESELFGVMPATVRRSSQRLDLLPWGTNVVDAAQQHTYPNGTVPAVQSPVQATRSYRLG